MSKPPKVKSGFNVKAIREALDGEDWNDNGEGTESRSFFLGTVFSLTPSGKYYLPFACGNVEGCPCCKGNGNLPPHKRGRIVKKWRARSTSVRRKFDRMAESNRDAAVRWIKSLSPKFRMFGGPYGPTCAYCGGEGSREAYLDSLWHEVAEKDLGTIGVSLENGDGDPCDLFAVEYRDAPGEEEED